VGVAVAIRGRPSLVLLVYFSIYILLGLGEELFTGRRRRAAARAAAAAAAAAEILEAEEPLLPAEEERGPARDGGAGPPPAAAPTTASPTLEQSASARRARGAGAGGEAQTSPRRPRQTAAALVWSSFFGAGYFPLAPGTAGTAAAIPLWYGLTYLAWAHTWA